jgi:hypothetical protein
VIKKDEMGRACSLHCEDEKCIQNLSENLKGIDCFGDIDGDGRIILKSIFL